MSLRVLVAFGVLTLCAGLAYGATRVLLPEQSATATPTPVPAAQLAPAVTSSERSRLKDQPLSDVTLSVDSLTADSAELSELIAKSLQVSGGLTVQGSLQSTGAATFGSSVTAASFTGSGTGLTGVNAALLGGQPRSYYEGLAGGNANLSAQVGLLVTNAARRNTANTFTAGNTFQGSVTVTGSTVLGATTISSLILGAPLSAGQGGTGLTSVPAQGVLYGQGGPTLATAVPAGAGLCLVSGVTDVQWGSCAAGGSVASLNGQTGALTVANATAAAGTITLNDATTAAKGIASFNSANFSVAAGVVNTAQNIGATATPTFAGLNLSAPLTVANGGTGAASLTSNGLVLGQGVGPLTTVTAAGAGLCLVSTAGAPSFQACPGGGGGVTGVNGQTGAVTIANATGSGGTVTIDDATTAAKGIASFSATNFSVTTGAVNTIQNIGTGASPTFAGINTNSISPSAALTVGSTSQSLTLQGSNTTLTATNGANVAQLTFAAPTANVTYRLQAAAAGTYDVCTTAGNCVGTGGGVTTPGGTTNTLPKFTGAQALGDSLLSDNGTLVTVGGNLSVTGTATITGGLTLTTALTVGNGGTGAANATNARSNLGAAASGANSDITSLSGLSTALSVLQGGTGATNLTANGVLLGNGASPVSSLVAGGIGLCLLSTAGAPNWAACPGGGGGSVSDVNGQTGAVTIANATGSGGTVTIQDASTAQKGIAQFNSTNFSAASGTINTVQDIASGSSPTFAGLNTNTITPSAAMTVGSTNRQITLQGNAASVFTATNAGSTTTLGFATPTANTTLNLPALSAGTYTLCTTSGNCAGAGGGVTTVGGSTNALVKFSGAQTLADSILSDNGTTVTVAGAGVIQGSGGLTLGTAAGNNGKIIFYNNANSHTLTLQSGGTTADYTYTLPVTDGSGGQCMVTNGLGGLSFNDCLSGSGPGGGVGSLNGLVGAISVANATGAGATVTINDASTAQKGIAQFNSTNFSAASGTINTIQDIASTASPSFVAATLTGAGTALSVTNNATVGGLLNVTGAAGVTIGSASNLAQLNLRDGSSAFAATFQPATLSANRAITVPNAGGTLAVSASGNIALSATGNLTFNGTLPATNGGTGIASYTTGDLLYATSSTTLGALADVGAGSCLVSGGIGVAPSWGSCAGGGGGVSNVNGQTGAVTIANATGSGGTVTIDDATTAAKGIASFSSSNFSVTSGAVNTIQNIGTGASPTFAGINTNSISPSSALTVGSTGQTLTLQGSNTTITETNGANVAQLTFAAPTANVTYQLQTAAAGTYDVCTTAGNCVGTGGSVSTSGGSANIIPKYTSTSAIGPSLLTDNGTLVTVGGNLTVTGTTTLSALNSVGVVQTNGSGVLSTGNLNLATGPVTGLLGVGNGGTGAANATNARSNLGAAASGANSDITSLSGLSTALSVLQGGTGATSLTAGGILIGNGTSAVSALADVAIGSCLVSNGVGVAPTWAACPGASGVTSVNSQNGAVTIANATGSSGTVTINDATTAAKGIASFSSTNFTVTSGAVNTVQNIGTGASPTFVGITAGSAASSSGAFNVDAAAALNLGNTNATSLSVGRAAITTTINGTLSLGNALTAANGGTGINSYTTGDLLYASGASTLSKLADVASGSCLVSGGVGAAPAWGSCGSSGITTVGAFSASSQTNGANITGNTITFGPADATNPGMVTASGSQTFGGAKTFSGVVTFGGGAAADLTTAAAATATALTVQPGTSSGASSNGAALTVRAGNGSGTTSVTGGTLTLAGGNATGASGTRNGGNVVIDAGTGATANGTISLGGTSASALTIGRAGVTTTINGTLSLGNALSAANGGTGQSSYAVGDLLYASGASTISKLADVATGSCLTSGGVGVAPSWGSCNGGIAGVNLQASTPGSQQTGHINVSGTTISGTSVLTPALDTSSAGALTVASATATSLALGRSAITVTSNGAFTVANNQTLTANGNALLKPATNSTTAIQIQNSAGDPLFTADTTNNKVTIEATTTGGSTTIFSDGYESGDLSAWTGYGAPAPVVQSTTKYAGTYAARFQNSAAAGKSMNKDFTTTQTAIKISSRVYFTSSSGNYPLMVVSSSTGSAYMFRSSSGALTVWNTWNGKTSQNNSTTNLTTGAWHLMEWELDRTAITSKIYLDGVMVHLFDSTPAVDKLSLGSADFDNLQLADGSTQTSDFYFDDVSVGYGTTTTSGGDLVVEGSLTISAPAQYSQRVCHNQSDGAVTNMKLGDCSSGGADVAEYYPVNGTAEPGDLVASDGVGMAVGRTQAAYQNSLIGVISTNPEADGILGQNVKQPGRQPVGLAGRVPLKLSLENGPVHAGDPLTSSAIPGVAMKATKPGRIIGTALEDYDAASQRVSLAVGIEEAERAKYHATDLPAYISNPAAWPAGVGKIMAFLNPSYYDPTDRLQGIGSEIDQLQARVSAMEAAQGGEAGDSLNVSGRATIHELVITGAATVAELTVTGNAHFAADVSVAGRLVTGSILVNGHIATAGDTPTTQVVHEAPNGATVAITGNDTAGTITVTAGPAQALAAGDFAAITFAREFSKSPRVLVSPSSRESSAGQAYASAGDQHGFTLGFGAPLQAGHTYKIEYFVIE